MYQIIIINFVVIFNKGIELSYTYNFTIFLNSLRNHHFLELESYCTQILVKFTETSNVSYFMLRILSYLSYCKFMYYLPSAFGNLKKTPISTSHMAISNIFAMKLILSASCFSSPIARSKNEFLLVYFSLLYDT